MRQTVCDQCGNPTPGPSWQIAAPDITAPVIDVCSFACMAGWAADQAWRTKNLPPRPEKDDR